jgi:hypothetical protein
VRTADLPALLVAYAAMLAAASWLAERLPAVPSRRRGPVSPWAREETVRFRKAMARVVRLIAAFVLSVVLVRFRATGWAWPSGLLLLYLAAADVLASRRAAAGPTRRGTPPV